MLKDKVLIRRFQGGDRQAFCQLYEKYVNFLLSLAMNLLSDANASEEVVQDVFVTFIRNSQTFSLNGSLKHYLATCVANRARDVYRQQQRHRNVPLAEGNNISSSDRNPLELMMHEEELEKVRLAVKHLSYEQRETLLLRLQGKIKFKDIARLQQVSIKTVQSRYRYGIDKLRTLLNEEV